MAKTYQTSRKQAQRQTPQRITLALHVCLLLLALLALFLLVLRPRFGIGSRRLDSAYSFMLSEIPAYSGEPYVELNGGRPAFSDADLARGDFEEYSPLDALGRCGTAFANVCPATMPTEPRGEIGSVRPSGWHTVRYNGLVDGNYLYNRCHLIAFSLAGENANERNLITGTRYLNKEGMLPFEVQTAKYIDRTGNHVLYRATPVFQGSELVARGVQLEAYSVEDQGKGVLFNVFLYNVQPGVVIDYLTGESALADGG